MFTLFITACDGSDKKKIMEIDDPREIAVAFFDAIYNEKDIKKAASVCSPKLARLLLHYKTSQSVAKHMFNMPFEKVTSIKPEDSGVKVRERYEDMATITVYIEGFFYGDNKKDVKRLSLIQNEKNHWVINEILKDPF